MIGADSGAGIAAGSGSEEGLEAEAKSLTGFPRRTRGILSGTKRRVVTKKEKLLYLSNGLAKSLVEFLE